MVRCFRTLSLLSLLCFFGCEGDLSLNNPSILSTGNDGGNGNNNGTNGETNAPKVCESEAPEVEYDDVLEPSRLLRRATLVLRGEFPSPSEYEALRSKPEDSQTSHLEGSVEDMLNDARFYDEMYEFALAWFKIPPVPRQADAPEFFIGQQRRIFVCEEGSLYEGAYRITPGGAGTALCNEPGLPVRDVEPWWAPGTTVKALSRAGNADSTAIEDNGTITDCGMTASWGWVPETYTQCGCGPNLMFCNPSFYENYQPGNPEGQRTLMGQEAARLFAHIAWHDRPLTDLLLGDYSVAPLQLRAVYNRFGRRGGKQELDAQRWWDTATWSNVVDPHHQAGDETAWAEFSISELTGGALTADRNATFDPRTEKAEDFPGMPSAGVLTSLGALTGWPRERVRGSRFAEVFACDNFVPPPPDVGYQEYERDPATEGTCQHCHVRIDPASIHFKRFQRASKIPNTGNGSGASFPILGTNTWIWDNWSTSAGQPWARLQSSFEPETKMTPVSYEMAETNPDARFIDFLPPDQTLYGAVSDGTIGPLGFGKLLVESGRFDKCVVRRMHDLIVGRDIDPLTEAGYLNVLVKSWVEEDERRVRPFIRRLTQTSSFQRGL